jgi:hypothetical protein
VLHGWLLGGLDAERLTDLSQIGRDALQRVGRGGAAASRCAATPATPPGPGHPWYHPTEQPLMNRRHARTPEPWLPS